MGITQPIWGPSGLLQGLINLVLFSPAPKSDGDESNFLSGRHRFVLSLPCDLAKRAL